MIKSFKIRLYPTKEQEQLMWKHIGCARFIYNYMLNLQNERYKNGEKHLSRFDMMKLLTPLKKQEEYLWLNEVSNTTLQRVCADLHKAFGSFFKKNSKYPRFKNKKKSKPNYPTRADRLTLSNGIAHIEKLGKVKYKSDFTFTSGKDFKCSNARISHKNSKWLLTFGMECENQALTLTEETMGIDLGIKKLAVVVVGNKTLVFHNINKSRTIRNLKRKQKHLQRTISRKYEQSRKRTGRYEKTNNILKCEKQLRKIQERLTNIRHNYIHQTTHTLVSHLPKVVIMEDLNVQGMMKNRHLSKAIQEQCFYEFIRQMRYKCEWNGIAFVQADRFYPSSKTCSHCGCIKKDLKLSDRTYVCPECGAVIDRDLNAAINLKRYVA